MNRYFRNVLWSVAVLLAASGPSFPQNPQPLSAGAPGPQGPGPQAVNGYESSETRIFDVKNADVYQLSQVLSVFGVQIIPSPQLQVLSVRAPKDIMPAIADAIKRLDVQPAPPPPTKNIELIIYVINATDQQENTPLPAPLQPVVNQLRGVLSYKGFQVVDTQVLRGTNGRETQTSGHMPSLPKPPAIGGDTPPPSTYNFRSIFRVRGTEKDPIVFLEQMRFGVKVPNWNNGGWQFYDVGINSDVEIPRGQQVVVGKTTIGERALILVMSAKVLD